MKTSIFAALFLAAASLMKLEAQVVTSVPVYPIDTDSVTIIFDATKGNGGLNNVAPPIYAHTGVITNLSTGPSDWKYVVADWNVNTDKAKMTPLGNNLYKLRILPTIRSYYGVPAAEVIKKMAFVFRNSDGSKEGKNSDGSDIFIDVYPNQLSVNLIAPTNKNLFLYQNDPIAISALSPAATGLSISVNGTVVKSVTGQSIMDTILADNFGSNWMKQWVKITAAGTSGSVADSFAYTVIPAPTVAAVPAGVTDGINYLSPTSVVLSLYAPGKLNAFAIGDFSAWQPGESYYMKKSPDGSRFWVQIDNLVPKQEYIFQYLVEGSIRIGDPYADKVSDPDDKYIAPQTYPNLKPYPTGLTTGVATYLQTDQDAYVWNTTPFSPPKVTDMVVYELLIRDFIGDHDYPTLTDTLDYLKNLGVNVIELMPVMEFEGNSSWGYNPDYLFAVDKYYGTKNGLKHFIEEAHMRGMAVVLDIVCNHQFGNSPLVKLYWDGQNQRPATNSPWFNPVPKHPYNVGYDLNHESPQTRSYVKRLLRYWLTEFHADGFRFDLSKGFTQKDSYPNNVSLWGQYDASRIAILDDYQSEVRAVNPNAYFILEHFADNSEETVLSSHGMILWGNVNYNYSEGAMGFNTQGKSDFSSVSYKNRGWASPNLVGYMESHDEERVSYRDIAYGAATAGYNIKDTTTSLKRIELAATFFLTVPGPKMIWEFGEVGYDYSIESGGGRLAPKPIRWNYMDDWRRRYTHNIFASLAELKKTLPVFETKDFMTDFNPSTKRLWLRDTSMDATVLGNFDIKAAQVTPAFTKTGRWYEFFTGDSLDVADVNKALAFAAGEYRLYTTRRLAKPWFTGTEDNSGLIRNASLHISPNPCSGKFELTAEAPAAADAVIRIYDLQGRLLTETRPERFHQGTNRVPVDLNLLVRTTVSPGPYFCVVEAGRMRATAIVIVR